MKQEHAGAPYPDKIASMIKDRVSAHRELVNRLENMDMSDPSSAAALVLSDAAMFIADEQMIPQLAYGTVSLLTSMVKMADESDNPMLGLEVRQAIIQFFSKNGGSQLMEVNNHEDGNR